MRTRPASGPKEQGRALIQNDSASMMAHTVTGYDSDYQTRQSLINSCTPLSLDHPVTLLPWILQLLLLSCQYRTVLTLRPGTTWSPVISPWDTLLETGTQHRHS